MEAIPIPGAEIYYEKGFLSSEEATTLFNTLLAKCSWERRKTTFKYAVPRDEAYYGDPGTNYSYSRREYKPLAWLPELLVLRSRVEEVTPASAYSNLSLPRVGYNAVLSAIALFAWSLLVMAQSNTESHLIALENQFNDALVRADLKTIDGIEADDLVFTDASGTVTTKDDELQSIRSGDVKFESIKIDSKRVQDFGSLAVVTGRLVEKALHKNEDISGTYRFTDVWAQRKGKWQHVAGQETLVDAAVPSSPSTQSDVSDVKSTLSALISLQLQYNADAVGKLLDPEFVYVSNDGSVVTRAEFINLTNREKNPLDTLEVTDVQVRASGDTAVATGTIHEKGLLYGKPYEFRGRTLITYARRNGRWLCLAIHD